jgi:hypothetical protein
MIPILQFLYVSKIFEIIFSSILGNSQVLINSETVLSVCMHVCSMYVYMHAYTHINT